MLDRIFKSRTQNPSRIDGEIETELSAETNVDKQCVNKWQKLDAIAIEEEEKEEDKEEEKAEKEEPSPVCCLNALFSEMLHEQPALGLKV
jgi:hypothetical protein